ncbi:MAG: hypothetical protein WCT05_04900 [Lentisphaeria bacterium]
MAISQQLIKLVSQGDLTALAELDARGIFCADSETATDFAQRIQLLNEKNQALAEALSADGSADIEDVTIQQQDMIPAKLFQEPQEITQALYRFKVDWVSGFFVDPAYSLLFGGCAYYFYPDFFALFIIRKSFREKARWLFYQRSELLAHELCHVARVSFAAQIYEEIFAYQTATTAFRRFFGGIFRSPRDSFLFLGVSGLLLINQIGKAFLFPNLPSWPFWCLLVFTFAWLLARHCRVMQTLRRARKTITCLFPEADSLPVLFRCNDNEIRDLASLHNPQEAQTWLENRKNSSLRWRITCFRFQK